VRVAPIANVREKPTERGTGGGLESDDECGH
jgi:hypothetical protein